MKTVGKRIFPFLIHCVTIVFIFLVTNLSFAAQDIPKFKIAAKFKSLGTTYSLLVPKDTTNEQVEALIRHFRDARKGGYLSKLIPPTTKGGKQGDYAAVQLYVFSEQEWASNPKFSKFMNASTLSASDAKFSKEYCKHIKAYYLYPLVGEKYETGSVGYFEHASGYGKGQCTPFYKKLF
jgi:hypothetical protein